MQHWDGGETRRFFATVRAMRVFPILLALGACLLLAGCAALDHQPALKSSVPQNFVRSDIAESGFVLRSYRRLSDASAPLRLYIEGDGHAWVTRTHPSADPTPLHPLALALAAGDPSPNVAYLARPCQYNRDTSPRCSTEYWTDRRFSPEVVEAMNAVIDRLTQGMNNPRIELVGYSGGAAIAALIAARRQDVHSLRTVAGNLDPAAVNRYHGVSATVGSLDPLATAAGLRALPQVHFIGGRDAVVPARVAEDFSAAIGRCARVVTVAGATHEAGWLDRWVELLAQPMGCSGQ